MTKWIPGSTERLNWNLHHLLFTQDLIFCQTRCPADTHQKNRGMIWNNEDFTHEKGWVESIPEYGAYTSIFWNLKWKTCTLVLLFRMENEQNPLELDCCGKPTRKPSLISLGMDGCFKHLQMVGFWFWVYHATRLSTRPTKATSQLLQSSFRTPRWCWPREGLMVLPAWGKFRWELQQETPQFSAEDSTAQRASNSNSALRWRYSIWISWMNQRNHWNGKMTKYQQPSRVLFTFPNLSKPWKHCNKGSPYLWGIIRPDLDWFSRILVYNHGGQLLTLMVAHIHLAIFGQLLSKFYSAGSSHWPWLGADVCGIALVGGLTQEAF